MLYRVADLLSATNVLPRRRHQPPSHMADDAFGEFTSDRASADWDEGVELTHPQIPQSLSV